jgi:hypothetical protein
MNIYAVITSIQAPTESVRKLAKKLRHDSDRILVIGDIIGPSKYDLDGAGFYSLESQLLMPFQLSTMLPSGHYSRKNIGYLIAISQDASCIYETDDDNAPLENWAHRQIRVSAREIQRSGWVNIFRAYSDELIWPRGFPLNEIRTSVVEQYDLSADVCTIDAPIQQGLAEGSPDVDAVWRLALDKEIRFNGDSSYYLPAGAWCPFNSQSTWWWPEAYPLLYLPSFCSFRMTDIWRGFIAQRCLWAMGYNLVFHPPEVFQERNAHDLMRDFMDEVPGYQKNKEMVEFLEDMELSDGLEFVGANMLKCYEGLTDEGFFPDTELSLVQAWLNDLAAIKILSHEIGVVT